MKRIALLGIFLCLLTDCQAQSAASDALFGKGIELYQKGKYRDAIKAFKECQALDDREMDSLDERKSYSKQWIAYCYYKTGDTDQANAVGEVDYYWEPIDRRLTVKSDSICDRALQLSQAGNIAGAIREMEKCKSIEKSLFGENGWFVANSNAMIGLLNIDNGNTIDGRKALDEAKRIYLHNHMQEASAYADLLLQYAKLSTLEGNLSDATEQTKQALNILHKWDNVYTNDISHIMSYAFLLNDCLLPSPHDKYKEYNDTLYAYLMRVDEQTLFNVYDAIELSIRTKNENREYEDALALTNKLIGAIEKISTLNGNDGVYMGLLTAKANNLLSLHRIKEATETVQTVIRVCENTLFFNNNLLDEQYLLLSFCYSHSGETYKAIEAATEAYKRASARDDDRRQIKASAKKELAEYYLTLEKNDDALKAAKEALNLSGEIYGTENENYALSLTKFADVEAKTTPDKAITDYYRAIEILKKTSRNNIMALVTTYPSFYNILVANNRAQEAQSILSEIKALSETTSLPAYVQDMAKISYYRLMADSFQGFDTRSIEYLEKIVTLEEKYEGLNDVRDRYKLAMAYARNQESKKTLTICNELQQQLSGDPSRRNDYAEVLMATACVNAFSGNISVSDNYLNKALNMLADIYGKDSENFVSAVIVASSTYVNFGLTSKALYLCGILKDKMKLFPEDSFQRGLCYMCLAQCELNAGNSPKAIEYGEAARAIIEKRDNKERYIDVLSILGDAYSNISQYNKALSFLKEAQSIEENKSHRYFSRNRFYIFQKLGMVSLRMGDFSESDTYYRVAHEIAKALFEEDNFEYGTFLYSLAQKDYILGRIDEAKEEVKKAKEIFLNKMGENTPFANNAEVLEAFIGIADGDISTSIYKLEKSCLNLEKQGSPITESLFMLLKAYCAGGEYKKAISTGEKLLTVLKPNGKELINHANTYLDMAVAYYNLNNADKYADYTAKAINIYKDKIQNNFLLMTKKERANIWNSSSYLFLTGLPLACHRLADHEKLSSILYDATLFGKGLLLQADNNITDIINTSGDEELSYEYSTLLSLSAEQKRLSTLFAEQTDEDMKLTLVSEMDSLYEDIDRREHHIMEHISDVAGKYTRKLSATWTDIKRALHKGEIAVEFEQAQYAPDSIFYYALVVTPDSKVPSYIPLTWQRDISARLPFATSTDADRKELTKAIWSPIIAAIPDIKKIYFSPVGELYDIPIESLPTLSEQDILMSKLYQVHRLSSTREIIADNNRTNTAKGMAIYGGLNYDTSVEELKEDAKKYNTTGQRGSDYLSFTDERGAEQELEPLPGTEVEAQSIIALINDDFTNRINVTPYLGSRGTEASFRALSGKDTRILHLGTHGFYYPQTAVNNSTRMQSLFHLYDDVNINSVSTETEEDKALSRCGLYLTGAQNRLFGEKMDGTDDGILTAREISSLHLENVDLAVLSACETGTGDITGEGVFGLQRGFKKAGTKAILMSLWKVNDESTSVLMTEFYRNWLQTGNMQDALEKAKSYVRSQKEEWKSPYYWAPFVLLDAVE